MIRAADARADEIVASVADDPLRAREEATAMLQPGMPASTRSAAQRALALAALELGDLAGAARHIARARQAARRCSTPRRAVQADTTAAAIRMLQGRHQEALDLLDRTLVTAPPELVADVR